MGEVAEMLDVSQSLLRFWEKEFDVIRPHRNRKGNRLFSAEDVRNLKIIYHLVKEQGMKLAAAKKQLKVRSEGASKETLIAERLHAIRAILLDVKQAMDADSEPTPEVSNENEDISTLYTIGAATESCCEDESANAESATFDSENNSSTATLQTYETADGTEQSDDTQNDDTQNDDEQSDEQSTDKGKRRRKPRGPKVAFKEVELFSLDELDAMQPKPGKKQKNDEVQQTLF